MTRLLRKSVALTIAATLALPVPAAADPVELATVPMANSTPTSVKPNLMFVLDDSGSMAWDYLPDAAKAFAEKYGYNSSHCNGNYYDPNVTYTPPVDYKGDPLNATPTKFTAAYRNGYNTAEGTVNLNTQFRGGSGTGDSGINLPAGPAFYYVYTGTQTQPSQKTYSNTSSLFYRECNSTIDSTPGRDVFKLVRLASVPTSRIVISAAGGQATVTITDATVGGNNARMNQITVAGFGRIMSGATNRTSNESTLASYIVDKINACTNVATGQCQTNGFSATRKNNVVTISGPAVSAAITLDISNGTASKTDFPPGSSNTVNSIKVGGVELLSSSATATSPNALATAIASRISAPGYSASANGSTVTITGPTSASNLTPTVTWTGDMTFSTEPFPESDPVKLQNFANWYSYYSNRMLMMKTGAGLAFAKVSDRYRVGFLSMNNNTTPGFVEADTFATTHKQTWFKALYSADPGDSTPLREALSKVGQYYAHKFGSITTYTATITVGGSGETVVEGITLDGTQIMAGETLASDVASVVASRLASQINAIEDTAYGAKASGNVVTVTGPASALGKTLVVAKDGDMTFSVTPFVATTTTAKINGVTPADPVQYSCQQNFTLLSTDGYWNGPNTYDLNGNNVGQVDGSAPRPFNDGAQAGTTVTTRYTRNQYSSSGDRIGGVGQNCDGSKRRIRVQPQTRSCSVTTVNGVAQAPVCTSWTNDGPMTYYTGYSGDKSTCKSSPSLPSPNPSTEVAVESVTTPGAIGGVANTLADVAMYYYQTDLRSPELGNCTGALGTNVCENNVFTSATDNNQRQHMTTFTLGLGVRGKMVYSSSYLTDTEGDYAAIRLGKTADATTCTWQSPGTVCTWPIPQSGKDTTTDDLWHAAVNGRGAYFSATDPTSLANGLSNALTSISSKVGAAAAAATSTLNPVAGNNMAFVASYTTLKWTGNLEARGINTVTGVVSENAIWCVENVTAGNCPAPGAIEADTTGDTTAYYCVIPDAVTCPDGELDGGSCRIPIATACTGTMNALVSNDADTRNIKTASDDGTTLVDFDLAYRAAHPQYFSAAVLSGLSQWPAADDNSPTAVAMRNNAPGDNLLKYLRGQRGHEYERSGVALTDQFYRQREAILGDALESQPAFIGAPNFNYPYHGYAEFKAAQASRPGTVYMGTNDGMMHAFAADTGVERWAYIPSMIIPKLWRLADQQYGDRHQNYVNGSPITTDVCVANCNNPYNAATPGSNPVWKTILVAGLNGGGRGYFALDITDPTSPKLLWEFTTSAGIGKVKDDDLGYTYGNPVVTRREDGRWVVLVTSGYNNGAHGPTKTNGVFDAQTPAGSGVGYLYVLDAGTGEILSKISTGEGTANSPSGLAKIAAFNVEPGGNKASYVYGGDLKGNVWRFDINAPDAAVIGTGKAFKLATLYSDAAASKPQPIMTAPALGLILGKRVIFVGTGKYLEPSDLSDTQPQSLYAIKDDDATTTLVNPRTTLVQQFLIENPDGTATRISAKSQDATETGSNEVDFGVHRGWFLDWPATRERVNLEPRLVLGTLLVPTIVPSATDCSPGGVGWLNFLNYRTGGPINSSPGLAGVKYDSTIVGLNILFIDGKPIVEVVRSDQPTPEKEEAPEFAPSSSSFTGKRVLWRELIPGLDQ